MSAAKRFGGSVVRPSQTLAIPPSEMGARTEYSPSRLKGRSACGVAGIPRMVHPDAGRRKRVRASRIREPLHVPAAQACACVVHALRELEDGCRRIGCAPDAIVRKQKLLQLRAVPRIRAANALAGESRGFGAGVGVEDGLDRRVAERVPRAAR